MEDDNFGEASRSLVDDLVQCRKCGKAVPIDKMEAELSSIDSSEHNVNGVIRRFRPTCPTCGPFVHDRVGHHGSITKKEMARLFPRGFQRRLRDGLPKGEQRAFMRTVAGKREPKGGEVVRWLEIQAEIINRK